MQRPHLPACNTSVHDETNNNNTTNNETNTNNNNTQQRTHSYTLKGDSSKTAETAEASEACWTSTTFSSVSLTAMAAAAEETAGAVSALPPVFGSALSATLIGGWRVVLIAEDAAGARGGTPLLRTDFGASRSRGALAGAWSIRTLVFIDLKDQCTSQKQDSTMTATQIGLDTWTCWNALRARQRVQSTCR